MTTSTNATTSEDMRNSILFQSESPSEVTEKFVKPFIGADVYLFGFFTFVFLAFGLFANTLTILVIAKSAKLRSIFHYFLMSLCVSDNISALISWVNWYRRTLGYDDFALPNFICVMYRAGDIWTSYVTSLHILSFAILRLCGIQWPLVLRNIKNNKTITTVWILVIWGIAFVAGGIPIALFNGARPKDRFAETADSKWPTCTILAEWLGVYKVYTSIAFSIFFYVPILVTVIVSVVIVFVMIKKRRESRQRSKSDTSNKRRSRETQAIVQLGLIVGSFLIGYIPFTAFELNTIRQKNGPAATIRWIDWHFGSAQYMCLRFSECLNPILYNLGSRTLWAETKTFVGEYCWFCNCNVATKAQEPPTSTSAFAPVKVNRSAVEYEEEVI